VQNGISMEKLEMNARAPNIISSEKSFSGRKEAFCLWKQERYLANSGTNANFLD
jgi:hypothetical protein